MPCWLPLALAINHLHDQWHRSGQCCEAIVGFSAPNQLRRPARKVQIQLLLRPLRHLETFSCGLLLCGHDFAPGVSIDAVLLSAPSWTMIQYAPYPNNLDQCINEYKHTRLHNKTPTKARENARFRAK